MATLKLVPAKIVKQKPNYLQIYRRIVVSKSSSGKGDLQTRKGLILFGVKYLNMVCFHRSDPTHEETAAIFDLMALTNTLIGTLTPKEFMTVFPIDKRYDGAKYEMKDYFTTMDELRKIGMDTPIGGRALRLCYDYQNYAISEFVVNQMMIVDSLRASQGEGTMIEQLMAENDIPVKSLMTAPSGKQFIYDPVEHTSYPVKKTRPRWARKARVIITKRLPS
ncbi:MAG: hypothetical protein JRD04_07900 [Deltaproteobacteria bacterium]|nr:hypothetical protein [Deltaproteobacteria bacterium]